MKNDEQLDFLCIVKTLSSQKRNDIEHLQKVTKKLSASRLIRYENVIYNTLRIYLSPRIEQYLMQVRSRINIPEKIFLDQIHYETHYSYLNELFINNDLKSETLGKVSSINDKVLKEINLTGSKIFNEDHKLVVDFCIKHKLLHQRYKFLLLNYILFGYITPFIFTEINHIGLGERKYKTKLHLGHQHQDPFEQSLCIEIFRDTDLNGLINFFNQNESQIKIIQNSLKRYENEKSDLEAETFKNNLEMFLSRLLIPERNYARELQAKFNKSENNIRTVVTDFKKRVVESSDLI